MIRVAFQNLLRRRLRAALTALAVVLGVALVSGALTLTDTMQRAADALAAASYEGTDAVISARRAFEPDHEHLEARPPLAPGLLARVRRVPQVALAAGDVTDEARIVDRSGKVVGSGPYFAVGFDARRPGTERLTPFRLDRGRFARAPGEVVIDASTARDRGYRLGDRVAIAAEGPVRRFRLVGIATFGGVRSIGTATFAVFDLEEARRLFRRRGYDSLLVASQAGVSFQELRAALAPVLPPGVAVETARAQDRFTLGGLREFVSFLRVFLVSFGGIALFVGAFTIFNALSITVAQRARELALLRTIGASRRQVLSAVLLEALAMGALASAVGVAAGVALAEGLRGLLSSFGLELPRTGLVLSARTVVAALAVGLGVTALAALGPALRATRVAPVAALREGAIIPPSRLARRAPALAAALAALGLAAVAAGMFAPGLEALERLSAIGPGCLALFVGVALLSSRVVPSLVRVLGAPARRAGGAAGALASRNAVRNPGRTAATAAALMIGIALVTLVAVLGAGLRESTLGALREQVRADYVLVAPEGWSPIDAQSVRAAARVPGVHVATGLRQASGRALGREVEINGVDPPALARVLRTPWEVGSARVLARLRDPEAIVTDRYAEARGLRVGDRVTVMSPTGRSLALRVAGISAPPRIDGLDLGEVTVTARAFARAFPEERHRYGFVEARPGAGPATGRALERALAAFPGTEVLTRAEFEERQSGWLDRLLALLYVLLALAVIVSLFGIVNTLALSVFERTRELGMLRAVGMTRSQVRRMIRHESVVVAQLGAVLGIALGLVLGVLVTAALADEGLAFAVPAGSLVAFALVATLAGVLAAIGPARRAARLNVLDALQYE